MGELDSTLADEKDNRIETAFRSSPLFQELERISSEEEPSYFESQAKRQHFIPRLMLKRFGRESDGKFFLFQLDVKTGAPQRVQIEDAASRRYFYAIKSEDGTRNNRIEGFLALVEQYAAPALEQLLDCPEKLADGDRATLSFFFALLDPRTPGGGAQAEWVSNASMRMLLANNLADPEAFAHSYCQLFGDESDEEIEDFRQRMMKMLETGEIAFSDPRGRALQLAVSAAGAVATVVFQMNWTLLRDDSAGFVTSDRGLAMHDPGGKYPWSGEAWGSSPEVEVTIPISAETCLLLNFATDLPAVVGTGGRETEEINLRIYGWAGGYIYGPTQYTVAAVRRAAKRRPQAVAHPTANHQVMLVEADPADTSIADANERRGWPRYLLVKGVRHDYFVIGPDDNAAQISARVSRLVRERAARQLGLPPGARPPGQAETTPIDPFDLE